MPRKKLTDAAVARLKPPASGQIDYFDAAYPALALRVSAKGVRSWVYFGRVDGKLKRATLGRYPDLKLMQARQKAGEVAEAMRQGIDPTVAKRAARNPQRDEFATVVDDWLKRDQSHNRSHDEVKRIIDRDVKPKWQGRLITDIGRRDAIELIDGIVDRGAPTMARRVHAHLHRLFKWCVGRGMIELNPMADLPKPGKETRRDRVLSDSEFALTWRAADRLGWPFGPALQLLMLTGARREEIGGLKWSEIDGDTIRLSGERTKNGEPREVPLSPLARAIFDTLPRMTDREGNPSELVFTTTGETPISGWSKAKALTDKRMLRSLKAVARLRGDDPEKVKLPSWRIHDLRRTVATGLQRLGVNLQVIEAVLGHVSGSRAGIVGVYQRHDFAPEARAALERWANCIADLKTKAPRTW